MKQNPAAMWKQLSSDPWLSLNEIQKVLNVSNDSPRRWLREGRISGIKVAGNWRIRTSEMLRFIKVYERKKCPDHVRAANIPTDCESMPESHLEKNSAQSLQTSTLAPIRSADTADT